MTAIRYFFATFAMASVVGPGTLSAASYQRGSCGGQKYGPLKISCSPRICTPFFPASWMSRRCKSIAAFCTFASGAFGSETGLCVWIRPTVTFRGMRLTSWFPAASCVRRGFGGTRRGFPLDTSEPPLDDDLLLRVEDDAVAAG